jgi:hypothetical protein
MGEVDLCDPVLESYPFSKEARKPGETDLHQLIYDCGTKAGERRHLGQYIMSALCPSESQVSDALWSRRPSPYVLSRHH